ncbi:hypothetical protein GCM10008171_19740 [Methylopila jiangsuensis]|uniref:Uncharacterized protein n=1 Tax=Methylopila jiangsuensis TaxID=586230 RepID=A0A9W6N3V6_9HYPH|nr:hypothetical protein [Methylopila jiangsuensis]MDR6286930.1 hypothetical protein [Methylopila jiangsuensis]GLK76720.1 hypothetical protein GCM10008171_19740 [Methylopila jiangsuensis]
MSATETIDAREHSALEGVSTAVENAIDYIGNAGASAGATVKSAAGKAGEVLGAGAYKGAYGASYGVVFAAVFLKELLPNGSAVRRGFEDGANAAFDAIDERKAAAIETAEAVEPEAPAAKPSRRKAAAAPEA